MQKIDFLNGCSLILDNGALILVDSTGITCDIDAHAQDIKQMINTIQK